ncbi:MAG TPA: fructose-6-phosphate aldolase [Candidatus Enterocloster faecavium]|uniref:Fructose-6-phosphate aldolase n=1 Tax=Candidatus Enterocloster faecavium TaxID=2838560 RepID=A0A9D2L6E4_9FIRM|nr:fructose-6-phosphate aldolase [Candidatus Enterocloster faecavium]
MKLMIDEGQIQVIRRLYDVFPAEGVTTNPSILAKTGRPPYEVLKEIRAFIGKEAQLHVQVTGESREEMLEESRRIRRELGENTFIKVPVNREGMAAIRLMKQDKALVTGTAVYTRMQAYLAAQAGADYVAPYVNRIDNLGADGIQTVKDIHALFRNNGLSTQVLAASFKNSQQVQELCLCGIGAATVSADVMERLLKNDAVDMAVSVFRKDFEGLCGQGKTMKDCG